MPWRNRPQPYRVWISEMMLQQTRVETAIPYFRRFVRRFPSLRSLASADTDDVLKAWEGLGYYARARNLHRTAREVVRCGGRFPRTAAELARLPGIGPYSAAAIASICYGEPVAAVDGNVVRVYCRTRAVDAPMSRAALAERIAGWLRGFVPPGRTGDFNQAMMELGATLCRPRRPKCGACPLAAGCRARAAGNPQHYPARPPRRALPQRRAVMVALRKGPFLLVRRRVGQRLLAGLWELPNTDVLAGETLSETLRRLLRDLGIDAVAPLRPVLRIQHDYSHFRVTAAVYACAHRAGRLPRGSADRLRWQRPSGLSDDPFTGLSRKAIGCLMRKAPPASVSAKRT